MDDPLARVKRAAAAKRRQDSEYLAALVAAHAAGVSFAQLARVAGSTRQNMRQIIRRCG